jgi:aminoglycoside phosphotransferase (APT) family kinase protein
MDKVDITPTLVTRLVAAQFPQWADLPVTPVEVNGWDNSTFRLGEDMSVRLPRGDPYALQVDKEQRWLPILAPQLPLPIPEPLATGAPRPWVPEAVVGLSVAEGRPGDRRTRREPGRIRDRAG